MARRSEDIDQWVGRRIGGLRRERGMSQSVMAAKLGISFQQVQKYEAGLNRVSAARLYQLAGFLDCAVSEFFPPDPMVASGGDPELAAIALAFPRIGDASVRRSLVHVVEALALR